MAQPKNYYQLLGVPSDSSEQEIKRAYRRLARKHHPDKAANTEASQRMATEFASISQAYNVLKDKEKRAEYDAQLARSGGAPPAAAVPPPSASAAPASTGSETSAAPAAGAGPLGAERLSESAIAARISIAKRAFARGAKLYQLGEYEKAVEYFEAAIKNKNDEPQYYARLARALMNARRSFTRAREMAMKAIELDPYNPEFRMILGEICETAGSVSLAIQAYQDVLKWDAGNAKAAERLAALDKGRKKNLINTIIEKIRRR